MTEEFKLIAKSKLEEIYHDQAELVDALRRVLEYFEWANSGYEAHLAYDNAVRVLGKATQTKGE